MKPKPINYEPGLGIWPPAAIENAAKRFEEWRGTPWQNRMAKRGVGIDCLNLVRELYVAADVLEEFTLPYYHFAIGIREQFNVMESFLEICCEVDILPATATATDGDAVLFRCGDTSNHIGMVLADTVV